jgi:hypothetical protein
MVNRLTPTETRAVMNAVAQWNNEQARSGNAGSVVDEVKLRRVLRG